MNWWKNLKGEIKPEEPLSAYTTFKIGGPVRYFIEPADINDLKLLLNLSKEYKISFFVIGAGSNLLAGDNRIDGLVVKLNAPVFRKLSFEKNILTAAAGSLLSPLLESCKRQGLGGVEFLAGIPGTIGGALMMNAGITEKVQAETLKVKGIGDIVESVTVMDYNGSIKKLNRDEIRFKYRGSNLSKYIILNASLKLEIESKQRIKDKIDGYLAYRKAALRVPYPCAGCVFKNPSRTQPAGRLIDLCGLKGKKIGGARIWDKHANFIVNTGGAKAEDVLGLMTIIRREVKKKFNVILKPEIRIWK